MGFDLFAMEQLILALLATLSSPVPIVGLFDRVDLSDESPYPAGAQIVFIKLLPEDQIQKNVLHSAIWSFDLYVDTGRISAAQKIATAALFSNALAALIGWEFSPGRRVHTSAGQDSAAEGRILRISFGFSLPVYLAG
jgi:hypothetical protein